MLNLYLESTFGSYSNGQGSSGAAFINKKRAAEARLAAQESGIDMDDNYNDEDIFELQHHHLLRCLEKTTVNYINC